MLFKLKKKPIILDVGKGTLFKGALSYAINKEMTYTLQNKKEISKKLKEKAINEGFTISGIASIPGGSRLKLRTNALERWLANNHHGEMKWMEAERRKNINSLLKGAKSVLSVGFTYINSQNNTKDKKEIPTRTPLKKRTKKPRKNSSIFSLSLNAAPPF